MFINSQLRWLIVGILSINDNRSYEILESNNIFELLNEIWIENPFCFPNTHHEKKFDGTQSFDARVTLML